MELIKKLRDADLSIQADILEKFKRPAIRMETQSADENDFCKGESKIGGLRTFLPILHGHYTTERNRLHLLLG